MLDRGSAGDAPVPLHAKGAIVHCGFGVRGNDAGLPHGRNRSADAAAGLVTAPCGRRSEDTVVEILAVIRLVIDVQITREAAARLFGSDWHRGVCLVAGAHDNYHLRASNQTAPGKEPCWTRR